jgi:adenylate cyclase
MDPRIARLIDRIDNAAALDGDSHQTRLRKTLLIFICTAGILLVPCGGFYLLAVGQSLACAAALGYTVFSAVALVHLLITRHETFAAWIQLTGLLFLPFVIQWLVGGFAASGTILLWSLLAPVCALILQGTRPAIVWFAAFALLVLVAGGRDIAAGVSGQEVLLACENLLLVSSLAFIALRFFITERDKAQAALEREQARSEGLLLNILPAPIAERLKAGEQNLADGYAEATILFADLIGFTKMSSEISPERLVAILNRLFSRFDQLSERHGVEKIKTIGDAYMVCAGVPVPRPDHAEAIADMALGMLEALCEHNHEFGSTLKIRIGINSGPVVAGVIGLKKFIYDLWGDTVNLASRMESHGISNAIQVSAAAREKLRKAYVLESRGKIEIKGIGPVEAWLLTGKKIGLHDD